MKEQTTNDPVSLKEWELEKYIEMKPLVTGRGGTCPPAPQQSRPHCRRWRLQVLATLTLVFAGASPESGGTGTPRMEQNLH